MKESKSPKHFMFTGLFLIVCMVIVPWLSSLEPIRSYFKEWTFAATEFFMLFLTVTVFFLAFLLDPARRDKNGHINCSWPP
ncbi:MAG: hypothetical protein PHC70_01760 [Patescibacteria group bacterium]|nr:hypothetical protein [Patescibacteria group bacterium]